MTIIPRPAFCDLRMSSVSGMALKNSGIFFWTAAFLLKISNERLRYGRQTEHMLTWLRPAVRCLTVMEKSQVGRRKTVGKRYLKNAAKIESLKTRVAELEKGIAQIQSSLNERESHFEKLSAELEETDHLISDLNLKEVRLKSDQERLEHS